MMAAGEGPPSGVHLNDPAVIPTTVGPNTIVLQLLTRSNYEYWSNCVKSYLVAQDLWEICTIERKDIPDELQASEAYSVWRKKNAMALHAIRISCSPRVFSSEIVGIELASEAWNILQEKFANPKTAIEVSNGDSDFSRYEQLRDALERGNLKVIKDFLKKNPDAVKARISTEGLTPLHFAARAGNLETVEELLGNLNEEDLEIIDDLGYTPLAAAALSGNTRIADTMIKKNDKLANFLGGSTILPVVVACSQGDEEMTRFFYDKTEEDVLSPGKGNNGATLLRYCISCKFLDIAMDILEKYPLLVVEEDMYGVTPLHELAQMTTFFNHGSEVWFWQVLRLTQYGLVSYPLELLGIKKRFAQKLGHGQANKMLRVICAGIKNIDPHGAPGNIVHQAVIQAIKRGNVKFATEIIKSIPGLMWKYDEYGRNIFSIATVYRQEKIFNLLHVLPNISKLGFDIDCFDNTMLHLAAKLPPQDILDTVSGAALQMQRELRWFKEAECIMPQTYKDSRDSQGKTPAEVFSEQHADLIEAGEKWMKDLARSSSFVAALVVTIIFAAAFTIPGGSNDNGVPIFLYNDFFMVFIISDSISLFSAITSVLMFLGILTSEYSEDKFLVRLPTELFIGLLFLYMSIAAMMVAFCASLAILLRESSSRAFVMLPIILFACIPVILFLVLQSPLLVRICISTYGPPIFDKKIPRVLPPSFGTP